jgi:Na+-transporting methylmalonyl-CoA/oxaloacetate decarboxylase gamma subunit
MINNIANGIVLTIVGLSSVFVFLSVISLIVFILKKTIKSKDITIDINIKRNPDSNLDKLEHIAAMSGALIFLRDRHSSLSDSKNNLNFQHSWFNK